MKIITMLTVSEAVSKIGIVVLIYNCLDYTRACLKSLRDVSYPNYEIVVVDNASSDGSDVNIPEEFPEVHYLRQNQNLGFTGGNNVGISWCQNKGCDAILLINNDTVVAPDFLTFLAPHLQQNHIVTPKIISMNQLDRFGACMGEFNYFAGVWKNNLYNTPVNSAGNVSAKVGMAAACCLLIPKEVFEKIGLFDDHFFLYYEDVDLITRAKFAGYDLIFEPASVIYHNERTSSGSTELSPLTLYYNVRNRLYLVRKYSHGRLSFGLFFLVFLLTRVARSAVWLVTGNSRLVKATVAGVYDYYCNNMHKAENKW